MVTEKDKNQPDLNPATQRSSGEQDDSFTLKLKKPYAIIGGLLVAGASIYGVTEALKSPEERAREAIEDMLENPPNPGSTITISPPTTIRPRPAVTNPNAPPATGERPEMTTPTSTAPEQSSEGALLELLAPTFSEIVNAGPVSPYDVALKVEDFPNPIENPMGLLQADLNSYSLIMTHAYGNLDIIHALYDPNKPYGDLEELISQTMTVGRFRFPPENDPEYDSDSPNFGSYYRAVETGDLDVAFRNGGNTVIITPFALERINFNYNEERGGWYLTRKEVISSRVIRTYEKQIISLENDSGELIETEVWRIVTQGS